ncbi:30 kda heat shock [Trichoderma cornu-damae]|uniref:30 kDa heat shock n=1 Tax=Trichoderma cornu-damae TaxID=654480 RepID=A0A9P8TTS3_9HYPO|nr:30 kda heat shock [Trichoderma cornu-damae]
MAAFFPRNFHHPTEASFTPLFRLLDDFDSYSRQNGKGCHVRRQPAPQWQPKFDVRETTETYELHGELPGISKENVYIEFSDPQTLVVRGKTERLYTAGTSPSASPEVAPPTEAAAEKEEPARRNSHQATVEDEDEASERESGYEVVAAAEEEKKPEEKAAQQPVDKAKYWLTERSIGEFSRSFHFPSFVEHESVSAGFQDGILNIVVPKAKKLESRRITVY